MYSLDSWAQHVLNNSESCSPNSDACAGSSEQVHLACTPCLCCHPPSFPQHKQGPTNSYAGDAPKVRGLQALQKGMPHAGG